MKSRAILTVVLLLMLLSACSTVSRQQVPVEDRTAAQEETQSAAGRGSDDTAKEAQAGPAESGGRNPAVIAMLDEAHREQQAGDHAAAASTLERALSVEPKDAYLWHRFATLRLEQKNWQQAFVLANKSNSLVRGNPSLRIRNWEIIREAKLRLGDARAVEEAEREIRRLKSEEGGGRSIKPGR